MPTYSLAFARLDGVEEISIGDTIPLVAAALADAELEAFRKPIPPGPSVMQDLRTAGSCCEGCTGFERSPFVA